MVFLIGILVGAVFVCLALRLGLYATFALMFNLVVSVYLALFLRPIIQNFMPDVGSVPLSSDSLTLLLTAIACFAILHGITFVFFTGPYNVVFPKLLDIVGAGILGFIVGVFVWGFISLVITLSPIAQKPFLAKIGFNSTAQQNNWSVPFWCGLVHNLTSNTDNSLETVIGDLLLASQKQNEKEIEKTEPKALPAKEITSIDGNEVKTAVEDPNASSSVKPSVQIIQ